MGTTKTPLVGTEKTMTDRFRKALEQFAFEAGYDETSGGFRHEGDHTFASVDSKANEVWQEWFEKGRKHYLEHKATK